MNVAELKQHVQLIVVVIMENRSFDHVLGHLRHPDHGNRADVNGIANLDDPNWINPNSDGVGVPPFWLRDGSLPSDVPHSRGAVATQLARSTLSGAFLMNGFVKAFEAATHSSIDRPAPLGLLEARDLPMTSLLADRFTVCDNWFACVPSSTTPNRLMSMCGATNVDETNTILPDQRTAYDWLLEHNVRFRVYHAGLPFFALMPRLAPLVLTSHFRRFEALAGDLMNEPAAERPQVIFIEPDYYDCPVHLRPPCDNHAPLGMAPGEAFLGEVYDALTRAPSWAQTALIVTYDEHGGFFDHVPPPKINYRNPNGVAFDSLGPRVPTIVAGPFAPRAVSHDLFDNTSILQLMAERFGQPGEAYSPEVQARKNQGISSISSLLSSQNVDVGAPARPATATPLPDVPPHPRSSDLLTAFESSARRLVSQHGSEALSKFPELRGLTAT